MIPVTPILCRKHWHERPCRYCRDDRRREVAAYLLAGLIVSVILGLEWWMR